MDKTVKFKVEFESNGQKVFRDVTVDVNELQDVIGSLRKETEGLNGSFAEIGQTAMGFDALNSIIGNMSGMVEQLGSNYASFDKGMRAVNTMAGLNATELSALTGQVAELSKTVPIARDELANGLYQVISNGVPQDNWIEFLEQSSRAAVGGIADLGQTVTVTSTILKNYGLAWSEAGNIQDKIQTTAKLGVTSFEQLAAALPRVTGTAATLGVSIDDLMATFATLTGVTGNTAEVSTQLAAVFTALVKPSSEAVTMAQQMGIQFDAAAVKAAGGFRNFLTQIDADIKSYASAHGMLDQEIYGKLFGSAESLRALVALNGELSDKFGQNVEAMADSAGTIDAAFEQNAGSADAVKQKLENMMATWTDWAGSVASALAPYLKWIATTATAINGCVALTKTVKGLVAAYRAKQAADVAGAASSRALAAAEGAETVAAGTAKVATDGLKASIISMQAVATLGASIIITVLVDAISKYISKCGEAKQATGQMDDAQEAFNSASTSTRATIDQEISKLGALIKANEDTTKAVQELNDKYGDIFQSHATAAEWYDTLVAKSRAYCTQLGYEAQAQVIAQKKAAKDMELDKVNEQINSMRKSGSYKKTGLTLTSEINTASGQRELKFKKVDKFTDEYYDLMKQQRQLTQESKNLQETFDKCNSKAADAAKSLTTTANTGTQAIKWQEQSYAELGDTIKKTQADADALNGVKGKEKEFTAVNAELDKMIARYNTLGKQRAGGKSGTTSTKATSTTPSQPETQRFDGSALIDNAKTYLELGNNVRFYQNALDNTDSSDTAEVKRLVELRDAAKDAQVEIEKLYESFGKQPEAEKSPASIEQLDTEEKLSDALDYYEEKRRKATSDERSGISATITALERKRAVMQATDSLPEQREELNDLGKLKGKKLTMELELIGLSTIQDNIRNLQKMLDTMELSPEIRKEITAQKEEWEDYAKQLKRSQVTMKDAWGAVEGIGNAMTNMTNTLKGSGTVWEKLCAAIDGMIQMYDGVNSIVKIVELFAGSSQKNTVAKTAEAEATAANAAAEGVAAGTAAATFPVISEEIALYKALAIAKTYSAYAALPFVGFATASGFVGTIEAMIDQAAIPKFADGGIAYGPTLGVFGEYSGAATNPEVVAPLDKLKSLIGEGGGGMSGDVTFHIHRRELVGVLQSAERYNSRIK